MIASLAILFACEDEYEAPSEFSDIEVYVPQWHRDELVNAKINVGGYFAFMDLSQGEVSHEWSFADTSGCFFLKSNLPPDSEVDNYYGFIDEAMGNSTEEARVAVLYTKGGMQGLRLYNTYEDSVGFTMFSGGTKTSVFDSALQLWVIDTTFYVDVYDSIVADYAVKDHDGNEIELVKTDSTDKWVTTTVEVGQSLTFIDKTTIGRPNGRTWSLSGGTPASNTQEEVKTVYTNVTNGDSYLTTRLTSRRSGDDLPGASDSETVPLKIKVIPPSANVEFLRSSVNGDGQLVLSFNQGVLIPDNSDINIKVDAVDNPITKISYPDEDSKSTLILTLTSIPLYGAVVDITIQQNTLKSVYETEDAEKRNDNLISVSTTSKFGVAFEWDFETGTFPSSGTAADFDQWGFLSGVTMTADADANTGSLSGIFAESDDSGNAKYAFSPFFTLEKDKKYKFEAYIKAADGIAPNAQLQVFMFKGGAAQKSPVLISMKVTPGANYALISAEFTPVETANNYNLRFGNGDFRLAGANVFPLICKIDDIIIFEAD